MWHDSSAQPPPVPGELATRSDTDVCFDDAGHGRLVCSPPRRSVKVSLLDSSQDTSSTLVADMAVEGGTLWAFADDECEVGYDGDEDSDNGDKLEIDSANEGVDDSDSASKQKLGCEHDNISDNGDKQRGIGGGGVNMVTTDGAASDQLRSDFNRVLPYTHNNDIHSPVPESHDYRQAPMLLSEPTTHEEVRPLLLPSNHPRIWQVSDESVHYEGYFPAEVYRYKEDVLVKMDVTQLEGVAGQLGRKLTSKLVDL